MLDVRCSTFISFCYNQTGRLGDHWLDTPEASPPGADNLKVATKTRSFPMIESLYDETKESMAKSVNALKNELKRVRTGRASLSILDGIKVDYYGTLTPLNQMATLAVPESRLITIQPWDVSVIKDIEKAILKSDLGLTPSSDGKIIRISIPPLTEERRKELAKVVHKISEDYKVSIRNIRRDSNELLKSMKKDGEISEDDAFKSQDEVQKITDAQIKLIDECFEEKEKEILEF
jgi:ribosome recycling factor